MKVSDVTATTSPVFVGDTHARPELLEQVRRYTGGQKRVILLGDLLDGPGGARGSVECVRLAQKFGFECVLGNHELYPIFAKDQHQLAQWWGDEPSSPQAERIWEEWMTIKTLLAKTDLSWLRNCPLYLKGPGWIAVHAKLSTTLPAQYVVGTPTPEQIALVDHTESTVFWAESYDGKHGHCYYGHTRLSKRGDIVHNEHATLLDWDAKKGGTAGVCSLGGNPVGLVG